METELIKEKIDVSKLNRSRPNSLYVNQISEWLTTDFKTLMFKLSNKKEFDSCRNSVCQFKRTHHMDYCVYYEPTKFKIYLIRG